MRGGGTGDDRGIQTAVDAAGNVYMAGYFRGTATFGTSTLTSRGDYDVYLAKYSSQGQLLWISQAGGTGREFVRSLAVDAAGNAYITGDFGTFNSLGPPVMVIGSTTLTGGSDFEEMFLAKYDAQGNTLWARQSVGPGSSWGSDVAVDGAGNVYLTGSLSGRPGGQTRLDQFTFTFGTNLANQFLAKYNSQGTVQWARTDLGNGTNAHYDLHERIAVDGDGQVYLVGYFGNALVLGTTTLSTAPGTTSMYLAKFNPQSNVLWVKQFSTSSGCCNACNGLVVDPCGDVMLALLFEGTFAFEAHPFTSRGGTDILLLKCSPQGAFRWGTQLGGTYVNGPGASSFTDYASSPVVDASGNSYLAARLYGSPTLTTHTGNSTSYEHLVSFSPTGAVRWTRLNAAIAYDVAVSGTGNLFVTGAINYPTSFDATTLAFAGFADAYLAKLDASTFSSPALVCAPIPEEIPASFLIPNIITPNNDGQNDAFRLPGLPAGPWQLSIYNRWGTRVYHADDYRQNWNAPGQPDGSYYYYLQARNKPTIKGWLEVIR